MTIVENKTNRDAEVMATEAMHRASKKGRWLVVVFSMKDDIASSKLELETMTTFNFPTRMFGRCLSITSNAMSEETKARLDFKRPKNIRERKLVRGRKR